MTKEPQNQLERDTGLHDIAYLGDGAYAGHDGWQVWVFTHDGLNVLARIALPPDGTFETLKRYGDALDARRVGGTERVVDG